MIFVAVGIDDSLALSHCAHSFILCRFGGNSAMELVVFKTVMCYLWQNRVNGLLTLKQMVDVTVLYECGHKIWMRKLHQLNLKSEHSLGWARKGIQPYFKGVSGILEHLVYMYMENFEKSATKNGFIIMNLIFQTDFYRVRLWSNCCIKLRCYVLIIL